MSELKLFGTDGIRGIAGRYPMDAGTARRLGRVFADFLGEGNIRVGICGDTRASTQELKDASAEGLMSRGTHVLDMGVLPTPAVAFLITKNKLDGAIMVSASHNPANENGLKFFSRTGFKLTDEEEGRLEEMFFSGKELPVLKGKREALEYASDDYREHLASVVNEELSGIRMVVDAGNGAAACVSEALFKGLGMDIVMINNSPNGMNINDNCGATHPEQLQKEVIARKADIGAAFDGDADRVILVDEKGTLRDGDYIMAIIGTQMIMEGKLNSKTLVATQYSNLGLGEAIEASGGRLIVVENGDKYVVEKLLQNSLNFGGEKAGHIILFDHSTTGDGILTTLYVLNLMKKSGRSLSELSGVLKEKPQVLVNVEVREKLPIGQIPEAEKEIEEAKKKLGNGGRVFVRYSGTQNLLRVMVEGDSETMIKGIAERIAFAVKSRVGA